MFNLFGYIPQQLLTTIISATAIIIGAIIGGICSWIITKNSTYKNIEVQKKIVQDSREYEKKKKKKEIYKNANIIRLDICTALFQSIRTIKGLGEKEELDRYPMPINKDYSSIIVSLKNQFTLKEISYIYQLYGIIESLNNDLKKFNYYDKKSYDLVKIDYEIFLRKIYGKNIYKILQVDIDEITYKELYDNNIIKLGYREVLKKLDKICSDV